MALAALWSVSWAAPLGAVLGLPVYAAQLLMLPLGFTQTVTLRGLLSVIQAEVPPDARERGIGLARFLAMALSSGLFLLMGGVLFALSAGAVPSQAALLGLHAVTGLGALAAGAAAIRLRRSR